jgi:hypothetical protein
VSIENGSQFCKDKSNFGFLTVSKSLIWKFSYEKEFFSIIYRSQRKIEKDKNMTFLAWSRMRFSKIYTLHRISENRKSVSTARESRVHFFHEPFFCEHEWDSQKNKIFVHLHKQSVKSKFACALFPHPWMRAKFLRCSEGFRISFFSNLALRSGSWNYESWVSSWEETRAAGIIPDPGTRRPDLTPYFVMREENS